MPTKIGKTRGATKTDKRQKYSVLSKKGKIEYGLPCVVKKNTQLYSFCARKRIRTYEPIITKLLSVFTLKINFACFHIYFYCI